MKILILGGTRLLGLALVRRLAAAGHDLTVLSRRAAPLPATVRHIHAERDDGLRRLAGERFDLIFDFLAYDGAAVEVALRAIAAGSYVLISSIWMTRLSPGLPADRPVAAPSDDALQELPEVTRRYLLGKLAAERVVAGHAARRPALILRLPIFWGAGEHTGRLRFYAERIKDGGPLILVDGGVNLTQVAWSEDLATALTAATAPLAQAATPILEALPHAGIPLRELVADIARGTGASPRFSDLSAATLARVFPDYLAAEPLWRETAIERTDANLFRLAGTAPTAQADWLPACRDAAAGEARLDLRAREVYESSLAEGSDR